MAARELGIRVDQLSSMCRVHGARFSVRVCASAKATADRPGNASQSPLSRDDLVAMAAASVRHLIAPTASGTPPQEIARTKPGEPGMLPATDRPLE